MRHIVQEASLTEGGSRLVCDTAGRPVGLLLAERAAGPCGSAARLYDVLLTPPGGLDDAVDPRALEDAALKAVPPTGRGRYRRAPTRIDLLETAEDRFGAGLDEEDLLFLLAYPHLGPAAFRKPLAMLLASPADVDARGDTVILRAPWRDFLVEASSEMPPSLTGPLVAGLVEGWTTVTEGPRQPRTRFTVLTPAHVEATYAGTVPIQEGDHVLMKGTVHPGVLDEDAPHVAPWRFEAHEVIVPARKTRYSSRF